MNQQPEVLAAEWALVTELLKQKHHDLPGEFISPVWLLRRLLAEALQCGELSLAEGVACMRALDAGETVTTGTRSRLGLY